MSQVDDLVERLKKAVYVILEKTGFQFFTEYFLASGLRFSPE
jgi:hypothetical protein